MECKVKELNEGLKADFELDEEGNMVRPGYAEWRTIESKAIDGLQDFIANKWDYFEDNDPVEEYKKYLKKKEKKEQKFIFITIQDFQRRIGDLDKLQLFINKIKYLFSDAIWCIESGKIPLPDSNLHIHILGRYINSKKAKNKICIEWAKLFNTDLKDKDYWQVKQHRESKEMPEYEQWLQEKADYFRDEMKGSHANAVDLGARGAWGVSTSFI